MAGYSARQSSYSDGDTITAAHTNDEFNAILAAFNVSTGHTHDGSTAGDGGPISKLFSNTLTFGTGADTDIAITFDGNTSDGVLTWKEDEDYFEFSDDILVASTEKLQFRDTAIYINSSADGQLDLVADTEIQIAATTIDMNGNVDISGTLTVGGALNFGDLDISNVGSIALDTITNDGTDITLDSSGDIILDADGADITLKDGGTTFGSLTNSSGELVIKSGSTPTAAITLSGANITAEGNLTVDGNLDVTGSFDMSDADITNIGSIALDSITNDGTDITLDSSGDIILDADGDNVTIKDGSNTTLDIVSNGTTSVTLDAPGDIILDADGGDILFKDGGTTFGSATNTSGNLIIKSGTTTALTFSGADVTIAGDLTVSGDDITMGTNTAGNLLIADGTNFNSVAVSSLSEISTVASDDVLLAIDTSGGGLKKITRSTLTAGIATGSEISNVVEDTSPQLGGSLDVNGEDIVSASNGNITLTPNGSGVVRIDGSNGIDMQSGAISIKNSGAQSYIRFYCESSNAHYVQLQAPAHADFSGNHTVTLPNLAATLATTALSETLTNKTLTTPTINGATIGSANLATASNGDITFAPDGTGKIVVRGNDNQGKIVLNCESNSHGQTIIAAPHSEAANNVLTLPSTGGDARLVSTASTATLTNKSIDSDNNTITNIVNADIKSSAAIADTKLATISTAGKVALSALEIDGGTDIGADLVDADEIIVDDGGGGTNRRSDLERVKKYIFSAVSGDATASDAGALTIANTSVETAMLANDAVTEAKIADDAVESEHLNDNIISGQTALTSGLATTDELLISDGGTLKRMDVSVLSEQFASADDATALAIALG